VDRETVLAALMVLVCSPLVLLGGGLASLGVVRAAGARESILWRRLWIPCLPAALAAAVLVGWAVQEPDATDEVIAPAALALIAPLALLWIRAAARAGLALWLARRTETAATVGLLRPRVVVNPAFAAALDAEALTAVRHHEEAHARHRDPLRIWTAQIATDLQWPWPSARRRLQLWLAALEVARDEEAVQRGADGGALAAGILSALHAARPRAGAAAEIAGAGSSVLVRERIERLLGSGGAGDHGGAAGSGARWAIAVAAALALALVAGVLFGDVLVQALPGVRS
jgi:hypothetical protein